MPLQMYSVCHYKMYTLVCNNYNFIINKLFMLVVIFLLVAYAFPLVFKQVFFFAD